MTLINCHLASQWMKPVAVTTVSLWMPSGQKNLSNRQLFNLKLCYHKVSKQRSWKKIVTKSVSSFCSFASCIQFIAVFRFSNSECLEMNYIQVRI
jgi:hypothetical protein